MKKRIAGFLHYRTDLGDGTRTGVVFSDCVGACHQLCSCYSFLPEHDFTEDSLEKETYSEKELAAYLREEKMLCYTKNLGITFLGQEPLSDPFFCKDVAKEIKDMGMTLQIYTCGMCPSFAYDLLDGYVDLYILRLFSSEKDFSSDVFLPDVRHTLETISFLEKRAYPYRILIPVLKGINDHSGEELAAFISNLRYIKSVILDFKDSLFSDDEINHYKEIFLKKQIILY